MERCRFCEANGKIGDAIIARNDHCLLVRFEDAVLESWLMILPIRHAETPFDLTAEEWAATRELLVEAKRVMAHARPDGYTVGCRFLCDEIIEGGSGVDDASYFGVRFAQAGMDYLSLSTGGKFEDAAQPKVGHAAYPYTGRSGWECMPTAIGDARGPFGRNVGKQAAIRAAVRAAGCDTPVVLCGGINNFDQAEQYLQSGMGDIIGAARQSLADPDWYKKLRLGRGDAIRRCIYTNYCEGLDQKHRKVTCQLWDRLDLDEPDVPLTDGGRRRLIAPRYFE